MLAFASTLDAVRCCHAAQAHLLFTSWPPEAIVFSGATEHMPDGRLVFRGPRMATAIHETIEYRWGVHCSCARLKHFGRCWCI